MEIFNKQEKMQQTAYCFVGLFLEEWFQNCWETNIKNYREIDAKLQFNFRKM